ncbi:hypothetical protein N8I77_001021 [Diaporthe amygdali]|uniref:Uncharacterized protein n=1 Tax=Phomopsis amygdali TaxID=1214568 RepID=A0AAD9SQT5_PHOAM|nr:hypothetical protein N8I77_001021 [Diaporthe amygdali]
MDDLKHLITPSLLTLLVEARIPFSPAGPLNFGEVARKTFGAGPFLPTIGPKAWPVLVALSKAGLDALSPEFLMANFLPPPTSAEFPRQCLGMQLLLDQAPRSLCRGVDGRWRSCYFDVVSQRFARAWLALPDDQRPDSQTRWCTELGASFDYWTCVRFWMGAPFVHSESAENQAIALEFTDTTRRAVEAKMGVTDPWRTKRDDVLSDIYGFPRVARTGPPLGEDVTLETWSWWWMMLIDIHKPVIDRFGRYPYNNEVRGRESTKEELEWREKMDHFAEEPPEVLQQLVEDYKAGIWQPLGAGKRDGQKNSK